MYHHESLEILNSRRPSWPVPHRRILTEDYMNWWDDSKTILSSFHVHVGTEYHSVPGKHPLPGMCPFTTLQGSASVQKHNACMWDLYPGNTHAGQYIELWISAHGRLPIQYTTVTVLTICPNILLYFRRRSVWMVQALNWLLMVSAAVIWTRVPLVTAGLLQLAQPLPWRRNSGTRLSLTQRSRYTAHYNVIMAGYKCTWHHFGY